MLKYIQYYFVLLPDHDQAQILRFYFFTYMKLNPYRNNSPSSDEIYKKLCCKIISLKI